MERDQLVARLADHWAKQTERIASMIDLEATEVGVAFDVAEVFDVPGEAKALSPLLRAHMQQLAVTAANEILEVWNPLSEGWGPELIEGWITKAADTNAMRWCRSVENHLAAAVAEADPLKKISTYLDGNGPVNTLGQSFATEAESFGRQDASKKSGLSTKTWRTRGGNVRAEHQKLNGQTVGIDDVFSNGLRWPGDFGGVNASETAACHCTLDYGKDSE